MARVIYGVWGGTVTDNRGKNLLKLKKTLNLLNLILSIRVTLSPLLWVIAGSSSFHRMRAY